MLETETASPPTSQPAPGVQAPRRVSRIRLFIRATVGISFFSVLSLVIAFFAFSSLPQVQDLLFDARPYLAQEIVYWAGFYAIGIFIWALPLVFTSRLLLQQNYDVIGIDNEARFKFYIFRLPSLFVVFAFIAVLVGIVAAANNLPVPLQDGGNKYEAPIRRLLEAHLITLLVATAVVLLLVIFRDVFLRGYGRAMARREVKDAEGFKRSLIRIERLTRKTTPDLQAMDIHLSGLKPAWLGMETWIAAQRVKEFMWRYMIRLTVFLLVLVAIHFLSYSETVQQLFSFPDLTSSPGIQQALDFIGDTLYLKRASFLFVVFGAWLPFIAFLALLSNRFQFPFIAALVVVAIGLTFFVGDGHDVRVARIAEDQRPSLRPALFADAVKGWKTASGWDARGCEWLAPDAKELADCPRPIIVSGEGGGSRAAFLLASVLGSLEDDSLERAKISAGRPFHLQLFAISSVSGSSVGAAFYTSALKTHQATSTEDLKAALFRQRLWFPNVATANLEAANTEREPSGGAEPLTRAFLTDFVGYKDALQAALSNDFISPVSIGFLARDVLTLSRLPFVLDRAGVLETAWEDAFNGVYGTSRATSPLSGPLLAMAPTPASWTPLLFLNAASNETGRRVIVTPVRMTEPTKTGNALFIDAYDLHELLCSPYRDPNTNAYPEVGTLDEIARALPSFFSPVAGARCKDRKPVSVDVRLSSAAGVSSRSPFVSPHAGIRDRRAQIVDSVVDGGYYDNSGAVTAFEIAAALKAEDGRLKPFILQVSSEPDWFKDTSVCGLGSDPGTSPRIPDQADFRPGAAVSDILTLNSTRIARGYGTIVELPDRVKQLNGGVRSVAQISICPQPRENFFLKEILKFSNKDEVAKEQKRAMRIREKTREQAQYKSVSLSWWVSPPLQAFLDGQIYSAHNVKTRNCMLSLLRETGPGRECQ
ncbi:hypothetical protein [Rhodomicrobium lacus]|uniref:hypothetical protein n=1 Tax=Rhodomicrobium lacus TaxID=2498452 RepID=UPI000F8E9BF8|nr:hypothetical protein [Rhodomicrobium lacus]